MLTQNQIDQFIERWGVDPQFDEFIVNNDDGSSTYCWFTEQVDTAQTSEDGFWYYMRSEIDKLLTVGIVPVGGLEIQWQPCPDGLLVYITFFTQ